MYLNKSKQHSNGGVAQLGEHLPCKQGVDSSILFVSTSGKLPLPSRAEVGTKGKTVIAHGSQNDAEQRFGRMAQRTATDMGS